MMDFCMNLLIVFKLLDYMEIAEALPTPFPIIFVLYVAGYYRGEELLHFAVTIPLLACGFLLSGF
jgi:hypothetical protein